MAADGAPGAPETRPPSYSRFLFRAPGPAASVGLLAALSLLLAATFFWPMAGAVGFAEGLLVVFFLPALVAGFASGPLAAALGGRFILRRSLLLSVTSLALPVPIALLWRLLEQLDPAVLPALPAVLLFLQGPVLWFRHASLFGVSNPRHSGSLPPALLQPLLGILGTFLIFPPTTVLAVEAAVFLCFGFLAAALLVRAADRPIRREFGVSGVALIRPLLDHVGARDPGATEALEGFFRRFAVPADLRVTLLAFRSARGTVATLALPTVHPGPFAALGSSDLPRKMRERLGGSAGVVFVPHTPCNHDLDLPTSAEVERVGRTAQELFDRLPPTGSERASPLLEGSAGSFARAQLLGDTLLVVVSQAPEPTDDIDFSVVDPLVREFAARGGPGLAVVDAHNSYVTDRGDLTYGTPGAEKLVEDIRASAEAALAAGRAGPMRAGAAARTGYTILEHGLGPEGIRALVVEAAGSRTAYVLLDGNNLLQGFRQPILDALRPLVDAAEVMTTDNHIVHEVDGGVNPVGERFPVGRLVAEVRAVVKEAIAGLEPATAVAGTREVREVPVLQPAWTVRLLTSLGDTLSMFANAFLTTFLLVVTGSLVVLVALR